MRITGDQFRRFGGRILDVAMGLFLVAMLVLVWNSTRTKADSLPEPAIEPGYSLEPGVTSMLQLPGTVCIVDDSNRNQLQFTLSTGAYTFTNCTSFTATGFGIVTIKGSTVTLTHNTTDRRLTANVDFGAQRASASLQMPPSSAVRTIADRNTANDICGCAP